MDSHRSLRQLVIRLVVKKEETSTRNESIPFLINKTKNNKDDKKISLETATFKRKRNSSLIEFSF